MVTLRDEVRNCDVYFSNILIQDYLKIYCPWYLPLSEKSRTCWLVYEVPFSRNYLRYNLSFRLVWWCIIIIIIIIIIIYFYNQQQVLAMLPVSLATSYNKEENNEKDVSGGPMEQQRRQSISLISYQNQRRKRLEIRKENKVLPHPIVLSNNSVYNDDDDGHPDEIIKMYDQTTLPFSGDTWWRLLFQSREYDMYDIYLNFKDKNLQSKEKRLAFVSFKRLDGNIPLQKFVLVLMGIYVGTRFWFASHLIQYVSNPCAFVALIFAGITAFLLLMTMLMQLSLVSFTHNFNIFRLLNPVTVSFYKSSYGQCLDDGVVICAALTSGLFLISHVYDGNSVAPDVMILAFIVVVVFQLVARGVSRIGLMCAWIIMIVCINITLHLIETGNQGYLFLNGELLLLLALSYEMERQPLRQYIMSVRVSEASEASATALAKTAILVAEKHERRHSSATATSEALTATAKLLAAANEIEHIALYSAEKAFTSTVKLLNAEKESQKLMAEAEAKALATTAILLAAANELQNELAVELATTLANTGILQPILILVCHY